MSVLEIIPKEKVPLLAFDGVCNLCNFWVKFVLKNDSKNRFHFTSLQSSTGKRIMNSLKLPSEELSTMVLIHHDNYYTKSGAALKIFQELGGIWSLTGIFWLIPSPLRNIVYDFIAKNRYKWFGRQEACLIPRPEFKNRFIDP